MTLENVERLQKAAKYLEIESLGKLKILSLEIINKLKNKIRVIMMFQWQRQQSVMDVKSTFKTMMNVLHI